MEKRKRERRGKLEGVYPPARICSEKGGGKTF